jgi:hypothetical protein
MDAYTVPAPADDLASRTLARVAREGPRPPAVVRLARWAAPPAAAAAALVLAFVLTRPGTRTTPTPAHQTVQEEFVNAVLEQVPGFEQVPGRDRFVVGNLDLIRDLDMLSDFDTLEAIEHFEEGRRPT